MTATRPATSPKAQLTKRQRDVLAAVKAFKAEHDCAPSVDELSVALRLTTDAVFAALTALVEAGEIRRGKAASRGAP